MGKSALELALSSDEGPIAKTSASNDSEKHDRLLSWRQDQEAESVNTLVCMEASGDIEEDVARILREAGYQVSVVNPRRINGYADSRLQHPTNGQPFSALRRPVARTRTRTVPRIDHRCATERATRSPDGGRSGYTPDRWISVRERLHNHRRGIYSRRDPE